MRPRERVSEVQRARILAAAVEVVGEDGYRAMSVARITCRARVSRRTFYDLFEDREACFLAAFEDTVARASTIAEAAVEDRAGWRERVRAGLCALLVFLGDDPGLRALVFVDALGAGPNVLARRAQVLDTLTAIVDAGRPEGKTKTKKGNGHGHGNGSSPPPLTAEGTVGAVLAVIHARVVERDERRLVDLLNPLMGMIVLPYLGRAAAKKELTRTTLEDTRRPKRPVRDPFEGLRMRVTHRTLRVLSAISIEPGISNRQVAHAAGVNDQGQMSKLLTRLERLGLIHNTGQGPTRGEPNAWTLTPKGQEIQSGIDTQTV
jgi:AcrR family transcriptional regulator